VLVCEVVVKLVEVWVSVLEAVKVDVNVEAPV